jgi:hypothetical protein
MIFSGEPSRYQERESPTALDRVPARPLNPLVPGSLTAKTLAIIWTGKERVISMDLSTDEAIGLIIDVASHIAVRGQGHVDVDLGPGDHLERVREEFVAQVGKARKYRGTGAALILSRIGVGSVLVKSQLDIGLSSFRGSEPVSIFLELTSTVAQVERVGLTITANCWEWKPFPPMPLDIALAGAS